MRESLGTTGNRETSRWGKHTTHVWGLQDGRGGIGTEGRVAWERELTVHEYRWTGRDMLLLYHPSSIGIGCHLPFSRQKPKQGLVSSLMACHLARTPFIVIYLGSS